MTGITVSPPGSFPSSPSFGASRASRSSSTSSRRPNLSLDMSNLPTLSQPTPPTNTLLITDLNDLLLFQPDALAAIRAQLESIAPLNSFSPLPSLRRIICSFYSEQDALRIRKLLDGASLLDRSSARAKIYFGEPTPIMDEQGPKLLEAPQLDKLFFISPPPSPPHGWVMRNEDPPNKEVHASDLAHALANLKTEQSGAAGVAGFGGADANANAMEPGTPMSISSDKRTPSWPVAVSQQRSRSSTLIYHPDNHGGSPNLPAVMVEDTSASVEDADVEMSPIEMPVKKMPPKTTRPPVELME
ncbi:Calcipressin-domain-containing protein [Aspergillus steynii IBT 23096]|uniref:Calcipressin-domain-containing protein n=1 Tax=Aspergillus steynii IBT 23096 TaxID=1392250 RepID=A0A2I2GS52_9EURO|nr:Calcipressin-domain-containing protein [Aspergillus steynii IBT 23096]PLB55708.1 Calcipressin-domain-containing protein [Aspergillus steynii IBT 23096]